MILVYRILTILLYPLLIILIYLRKFQNKEHKYRFREKIFPSYFNVLRKENSKLVWFHAASIGEMKSILPLINELNKKDDNFEFLITTVTLSSSNLAERKLEQFDNVQHRFFPLDIEFLINQFLIKWKPNYIFLLKHFMIQQDIWKKKKRLENCVGVAFSN